MWLSVAGKYIALSWRIFLINFSSALSFRLSFLLHCLGAILFYTGQILLWIIFYTQFPSVGGWTIKDVTLVNALFMFSYSILDVFAGGVTELAHIINNGNLDYFLVFPKSILWHIAVSRSDIISIGTIAVSLVLFWLSGPLTLIRIAIFLLASFFSMVLMFNYFLITQSLAFFVSGFDQGAIEVRHMLGIVSLYPFSIFPSPFKYLLMTLVPSFFVVTLPMQLVDAFSLTTFFTLVMACIVLSGISYFIFSRGLRRYESGNLLSIRL